MLRGFRMRKQLIQRPGFFSVLVRLSLAYVISNRIPLISACPVSEAFSHTLRTLLLPRTLHLPGVIFAEDSKKGRTREKRGGFLRNQKASVRAASAGSTKIDQMRREGEARDQRTQENEGMEVGHLATRFGGPPDTAEMSGQEGMRKTGRRKGKAARVVPTRIRGSGRSSAEPAEQATQAKPGKRVPADLLTRRLLRLVSGNREERPDGWGESDAGKGCAGHKARAKSPKVKHHASMANRERGSPSSPSLGSTPCSPRSLSCGPSEAPVMAVTITKIEAGQWKRPEHPQSFPNTHTGRPGWEDAGHSDENLESDTFEFANFV